MADFKAWWSAHKPTTRRLAQLYAALLYNANLKGFVEGRIFSGDTKAVCVPGFNCYSCPGAIGACPLGSLQNALNGSGHTAPWYMLGILMLYGLILGRTICGWLCPLGLIQELLHKIPTPKIRKSRVTRALSYLKYVILAVFVIAVPIWYGVQHGKALPAFCKYICPAGTLEGAVGLLSNPRNATSFYQLKVLFTRKFVIMLAIGLECVFCYRAFCRFLCPLGAIYGLFNRFAITGVKVNPARCNGCGACVRNCHMDVRHVGDHECISCGKCIDHCAQGAIALKCGRLTLKGPETGKNTDPAEVIAKRKRAGRLAWSVAVVALAALLVWMNVINAPKKKEPAEMPAATTVTEATAEPAAVEQPEATTEPEVTAVPEVTAEPEATAAPAADITSDAPIGADVGNQLADFTTDLIGGGEFHLAEHRGHVVFINLWATYCPPCVEELPYFNDLAAAHPDAAILAVHHATGAKKADAFLEDKGWDHLMFAKDSKDKGLFDIVNGSEAMPQTIVLNPKGEVVYNAQSPLTYDQLEALYKAAGGGSEAATTATEPETTAEPEVTAEPEATTAPAADTTSDAPIGADVGNQLADFTTDLIGGGEFHLADHRGQVVFINLWATYCPPCVEELPYFNDLAAAHPDAAILAVHHATGAKKADAFLEDKGWDHLMFAKDSKDKGLFDIVNGSEAMPQTIVLNPKGEVVYNAQSPLTYDQLEALYGMAS